MRRGRAEAFNDGLRRGRAAASNEEERGGQADESQQWSLDADRQHPRPEPVHTYLCSTSSRAARLNRLYVFGESGREDGREGGLRLNPRQP